MNPPQIDIRNERLEDIPNVYSLTQEAFRPMSYASGTEQDIVDALRREGALVVSLVAVLQREIIGHVAFSPVQFLSGASGWYALGPVSVRPRLQRQGIGTNLITKGLDHLKSIGASGCVLVGNPRYYGRFGFTQDTSLELERMSPSASLVLRFQNSGHSGFVRFHDAFFRSYAKLA
jgi:predicted N-acetyltransferase YhbS